MVELAPVLAVESTVVTVSTGGWPPGVITCDLNWTSFPELLLFVKYFVVHLMINQDGVINENLSTKTALERGVVLEMRVV